MDRIASSSSPSSFPGYRSEIPTLLSFPEESIVKIISLMDKADNQTLSSLAQTCTDLWRIAGTESLLSFFYAAKESFENSDTDRKVAIFSVLADWITEVSSELPDESRWKILLHLADMADLDATDLSQTDSMRISLNDLLITIRNEIQTYTNSSWENSLSDSQDVISKKMYEIHSTLFKRYNSIGEKHLALTRSIKDEHDRLCHLINEPYTKS